MKRVMSFTEETLF